MVTTLFTKLLLAIDSSSKKDRKRMGDVVNTLPVGNDIPIVILAKEYIQASNIQDEEVINLFISEVNKIYHKGKPSVRLNMAPSHFGKIVKHITTL